MSSMAATSPLLVRRSCVAATTRIQRQQSLILRCGGLSSKRALSLLTENRTTNKNRTASERYASPWVTRFYDHHQQQLPQYHNKNTARRSLYTLNAHPDNETDPPSSKDKADTISSSPSSEQNILLEHLTNEQVPGGVISLLTLNRPQAANAMSRLFMQQLSDALTQLEADQETRCLVITSASPKVFSAGADLKERRTMTVDEAEATVVHLRETMQRVADLPMPVIASVSGVAVAGGLELALAADLRVANQSTVLGLVETSLGIVPGAGGTQRLSRLIGMSKAKELIFTASKIKATTALRMGLVDHVMSQNEEVLDKSLELAWTIAQNGPLAVRAAKEAMNQGIMAHSMEEALDIERINYQKVLTTEDRLEGLAAFAEKRKPHYKGK